MPNAGYYYGLTSPQEIPGQIPSRANIKLRAPKTDVSDSEWQKLIQDALNADNEIRFRQRIGEFLATHGMSKRAQRSKLREAVAIYRKHRKGTEVLIQNQGVQVGKEKRVDRVARHVIQNVDKVIPVIKSEEPVEAIEDEADAVDADNAKIAMLRDQIYERVLKAGHIGLEPKKLHDLVARHGAGFVMRAIKSTKKIDFAHGHFFVKDKSLLPTPEEVGHIGHTKGVAHPHGGKKAKRPETPEKTDMTSKAAAEETSLPEQLPIGANVKPGMGTHNMTQGVSDRALPVGARKIWNRRVVEKKPDMRWHVVGHVAGLENPSRVPQVDAGALDREALLHLLQQLLRIRQAQRDVGKDDSSNRDGVSAKDAD